MHDDDATSLSQIPAGIELPDDQKVYLLRTPSGRIVMHRIIGRDSIAGFILAFTTRERARVFVKKFSRQKFGGILEVPLKEYLDRPNQPLLALDLDPDQFDYA